VYDLVKFLSLWIYPLGTAVLLWFAGLLLVLVGRKKFGVGALSVGFAWLWIWSMPAVADRAVRLLESDWTFEAAEAYPEADAIVILGGAFSSGLGEWPYPDAGGGVDRYWHGARLYHAGRAPVLVLSGGRNLKRPESWSEAESGAMFLTDLGVPESAMLIDTQARTTRENVINIAALLEARGFESFLLVTSARHMRRSVAAFQAEGLAPIAAPADFGAMEDPVFSLRRFMPNAAALSKSTGAMHEWVGLWFYRLSGWA
jgi:uncharacterized SAM-binding protein YcdF (DUF218 family)